MAKLTLNNISSGYISTDALNTNFDLIETALENTLSRDGTSPNPMQAHLDMDGYDILNIGDALIGGVGLAASVTAAGESASEAAISAAEALVSETNAAGDAAIAAAAAFELEDLEYRGAWVAATAYLKNNIVYYSTDGASYICLASHTADADFAVDLGAARWGLLALRGAAGAGTGDMLKSENLSGLANYTTARSNLGLTIGVGGVQAYDADLAAIAALTTTAYGRAFLVLADAPAARTTLELTTVGQAEAEAGTATTTRAWTAERVKQAVVALSPAQHTLGTVSTPTGVAVVDYVIPVTAKRIMLSLSAISFTDGGDLRVQLGTGGTPVSSGYIGGNGTTAISTSLGPDTPTGTGASTVSGLITFCKVTTNVWAWAGEVWDASSSTNSRCSGVVNLGGEINLLRVFNVTSANFDAGSLNILVE